MTGNTLWNVLSSQTHAGFTGLAGFSEEWLLHFTDPLRDRAISIRWHLLASKNGFRKAAETYFLLFQRNEGRETTKIALKQSHDISAFSASTGESQPGVRIGDCEITGNRTRGEIQYKGKSLRWDLAIHGGSEPFGPEFLSRLGIERTIDVSNLRVEGRVEVDGEKQDWSAAPASLAHSFAPRGAHSWVAGQCVSFRDEKGEPAPLAFEGLTLRARLGGGIPSPKLSSFYFRYRGTDYRFHTLWDSLRVRSRFGLTNWEFQAERDDLSFKGVAQAEYRDFAGQTLEDTDGSLIYACTSGLAQMTVLIYRRGKLEMTCHSPSAARLELAGRTKNPYVPPLY